MMIRRTLVFLALALPPAAALAQTNPGNVPFRITPVSAPSDQTGHTAWLATYGEGSKFIVTLRLGAPSQGPFQFATGAFRRVEGSNSQPLLSALAKALGAKTTPAPRKAVQVLPFNVAILGTKRTRLSAEGGFTSNPPGTWVVTRSSWQTARVRCTSILILRPVRASSLSRTKSMETSFSESSRQFCEG